MTTAHYLLEQVKQILPGIIEQEFPENLIASERLIEHSQEIPPGKEVYVYPLLTRVGQAKIIADNANDVPRVNAYIEERTGFVRTIGNYYEYTRKNLQVQQSSNSYSRLDVLLSTARMGAEQELERIGFLGDSAFNLLGLANHPNVPIYLFPNDGNSNGGVNSTRFIHKTPAQQYRDLMGFASSMRVSTKYIHKPKIIGLGTEAYEVTTRGLLENNETVLSVFLRIQRTLGGVQDVIPMPYLDGRGPANTDIAIAINKMRQNMVFHMVEEFFVLPPQPEGFGFNVYCGCQTGGTQLNQPFSMSYAYGG
jgi:hypothetical protein